MRNFKSIIPIVIIFALILFFSNLFFLKQDFQQKQEEFEPSVNLYLDYYVYIDNENKLTILDKETKKSTVLSNDVIEFHTGDEYIVYISKNFDGKKLLSYSFATKEITTIKDYYTNDFFVYNDYLYLVEENTIYSYNLNTTTTSSILTIHTSDIIFNYIDNDKLIYSSLVDSISTTQEYLFESKITKKLFSNASNIIVLNDYIYALNDSMNLFRLNKLGQIETISDLTMINFFINDDILVYIDEQGKLNTIEISGTHKIIADSVSDFNVINNNIYYMSPSAENKIFKAPLTGRHKETIIQNANLNFNFDELEKL